MLLVADDGTVHDITDTMTRTPGGGQFEVSLTFAGTGGPKPLLLLALASAKPLMTLSARPLPPASQLFPILSEEGRLSGQHISAAMKYLRLQG
jgi:hypothetical protein